MNWPKVIDSILNLAEDRPDSIRFLFFVGSTDTTGRIYKFLKGRLKRIISILQKICFTDMTIAEFREIITTDNKRLILENEVILEKAFNHCILLKSIPWIKFMFTQSSKYLLRLSINISTVVTLVTEYEDKTIQRIILLLLSGKDPEDNEQSKYWNLAINAMRANNSLCKYLSVRIKIATYSFVLCKRITIECCWTSEQIAAKT